MDLKILVCCHKEGLIPKYAPYFPIQVGKELSKVDLEIQGDNTSDNISIKNENYCELTALYWAWKNLKDLKYIGICHYRRYFDLSSPISWNTEPFNINNDVIPNIVLDNISILLRKYDVILPGKSYLCNSIRDSYSIGHSRYDYEILEKVITELTPDYLSSFHYVSDNTHSYCPCNMMICSKELFDEYCDWLFTILFEVERRLDINDYDNYQKRIFGFMSERLLNVFVYHKRLKVAYRPIVALIDKPSPSRLKCFLHRIKTELAFSLIK